MLLCYWYVIAAAGFGCFLTWAIGEPKRTRDRAVIICFFVAYIASVCFRASSVGVDTINYIGYFETGSLLGWNNPYYIGDYELGFQLFSALISLFGGSRLFIIVAGLISVIPIAVLYYRESENGLLCCSFFLVSLLFEFFFSGIRQGLAVGIGVIAYFFAKKKRMVPFLASVAFAATMHASAIIILCIYPFYHAKITQKWIPVVAILMAAVYIMRDFLFNGVLLPMFGGGYLAGYSYLSGDSGQGALSVLFLLLAAYACVMLDPEKADPETLGLRNILLLATAIHMFTPLHPVVCRVNYYFIPFIPLAVARVNDRVKPMLKPVEQIVSFILPIFFIAYFLFAKGDSLQITPYIPYFY